MKSKEPELLWRSDPCSGAMAPRGAKRFIVIWAIALLVRQGVLIALMLMGGTQRRFSSGWS